MLELIVLIIFIVSLSITLIIVFRKIPQILALPETSPSYFNWRDILKKIKIFNPFKGLSFEMILQKILSRVRVLSLKTENKSYNWLKRLRMKAKIRKNLDANYWKEIEKSTKNQQ